MAQGLLDIPVLYLSRYIVRNKAEYYRLLQAVRDRASWESWIFFMLSGVSQTAQDTLRMVRGIGSLMLETKHRLRSQFPRIYSQDLLNNLFRHPYTRIDFVRKDLEVSRVTASKYLHTLANAGYLTKRKLGRSVYFVNDALVDLLCTAEGAEYESGPTPT